MSWKDTDALINVCDLFFDTLWTMVKHLFGQLTVVCR